jgi:hypothetical protein
MREVPRDEQYTHELTTCAGDRVRHHELIVTRLWLLLRDDGTGSG